MASRSEIVETAAIQPVEDKMYVAVGKDLKESKSTLTWALHNSGGRKICILHVHQPAQMIPILGTKMPASQLDDQRVKEFRESEKQNMHKLLDEYSVMCDRAGVRPEVVCNEMDSIEKGIVELISQHGIRKLVMGAAADKQYSKKMMEPKSKKAIYVRLKAPESCHIWFICKGNLIYTREGKLERVSMGVASLSLQASPNTETMSLRSQSIAKGKNNELRLPTTNPDYRRIKSEIHGRKASEFTSPDGSGGIIPQSRLNSDLSYNEWEQISRRSPSLGSHFSSSSSSEIVDDSALSVRTDDALESLAPHHSKDNWHSSPPSVLDGCMNDELYDQLDQTMAEADNARQEAFEESKRRRKAEKDAIEAIRRLDELIRELHSAQEQKLSMECQIANSDQLVQELKQKVFSAVELLQKYKNERDDLQVERDDALQVAEELRRKQAEEASSSVAPQFFSEFSFSEIEEATQRFDPSLKIGEGGYGSIYKGILRHTQVAIKMLHTHSLQGPSEFQQEVDILSKLRHPNLVTLIGACPEAWILVYEYLANGSLEDRLNCKDNSPPLSWQTRISIATELCSVLIFLHSCNLHAVVHGDLKPANILLDANYVSKLSDFGICRIIHQEESSSINTTLCCRTGPKGTFVYMDPEFLATGELTAKSDVYSFGIILLRLLTGRPALGITKEVQYALDKGNLKDLLDPTAGDWPYVQAKQLAHLAMRCCEMSRKNRPDLASEVWKVLDPMRVSCRISSFRPSLEERSQIPSYFICPIFQEVMQDPHVAADGFTYELEALRGWLDSGHDTSPMTNLKLSHCNPVPNHALRSAIQEWLQQP
ncbi:Non-specific serine/threonine protein kinase [Bertholletia excelsa]